jgi:hypothetical protein
VKWTSLLFAVILVLILNTSLFGTVNILVSTYDGLVIAADSRVTLVDSGLVRIASDTYQKIFQVGTCTGVSCSDGRKGGQATFSQYKVRVQNQH